jgi:hypothetical protein
VRAKSGGTILTAPSAKGSTAAQGTPLAVIADLTQLVVNLKVPEKQYDLFRNDPSSLVVTVSRHGEPRLATVLSSTHHRGQSKVFGVRCLLSGDVRRSRAMSSLPHAMTSPPGGALQQTVRKADGSVLRV